MSIPFIVRATIRMQTLFDFIAWCNLMVEAATMLAVHNNPHTFRFRGYEKPGAALREESLSTES